MEQNNRTAKAALLPALAALLLLLFVYWARVRLLAVPMERDEGEYAYGGQLLLQGLLPYLHLHTMKLPGIFAVYASIFTVFGESLRAVHLGLLIANVAAAGLLYAIGARLYNRSTGIGAALFFAVLAVLPEVQGVFANAEHFVLVFALAGILALLPPAGRAITGGRAFAAGLLLGCGFLVKQHGAAFCLLGAIIVLLEREPRGRRLRNLAALTAGGILPYLVTLAAFAAGGGLDAFWFWTVSYARAYSGILSASDAWFEFKDRIVTIGGAAPFIWLLALGGLAAGGVSRRGRLLPPAFFLFSFLAVCPGFYFRPHYFLFLLPAAALFAAVAADRLRAGLAGAYPVLASAALALLFALAGGSALYAQRAFLFTLPMDEASREVYWPNPFQESLEIGRIIAERTTPADTVAILGSEPQIFFYAKRRSATPYVYMYPLMEQHRYASAMQQDMIRQLEAARPKIMLFVRVQFSWLQGPQSDTTVLQWFDTYSRQHYRRVGLVQIFGDASLMDWNNPSGLQPRTPYWVEVLERVDPQG